MAHRRGGFQKKIDVVHWTTGIWSFSQSAGTGAALVLAAQHLPETLLRIRGEWIAAFQGALADARGARITCGLILVPEGTGSTVLWSPTTDGDAPWIWWDVMHLNYEEYVVDAVVSSQVASGRRVIDSKAMRKVRNTELQLVAENTTTEGAEAINIAGQVRVLAGS